jgi:O-antigen ligase
VTTVATSPAWKSPNLKLGDRKSLSYSALVLFTFLYYWRPEDLIPGLVWLPLAKISGGIALLALIFGARSKDRQKLPLELKVLLTLLGYMFLTIPFAYWRGGAFDTVVNKFSKGVIVAMLIALIVTQVRQMRKLLFVQVSAVVVVTLASVAVHHTVDGRLWGIQKSVLENPNDLSINIAMTFPLCLAFLLAARGGLRKMIWGAGLAVLLLAVVLTYSRSGMIATVITVLACIWEYGIKGKRRSVLLAAVAMGIVGAAIIVATPRYLTRVTSIVRGNVEGSGDRGSLAARKQLLLASISTALHHPVFGVGPGNFEVTNGEWRVAHNSYTELAAEAGLPALALFLTMIFLSFRKINSVRKLPGYAADESIRLWTSALWAGLAAYVFGAMFASTEYNLFPYFMVGYVSALYQIAVVVGSKVDQPTLKSSASSGNRRYETKRKYEPVKSY